MPRKPHVMENNKKSILESYGVLTCKSGVWRMWRDGNAINGYYILHSLSYGTIDKIYEDVHFIVLDCVNSIEAG